jgi:hypothetical protein
MESVEKVLAREGTKYAVAMRDASGLWLLFSIRRDPKGDVYADQFNKLPDNPDIHVSSHRSGEGHVKSAVGVPSGKKVKKFLVTHSQKLDASFRGKKQVFNRSISAQDFRALDERCEGDKFSGLFEIPKSELPADEWHSMAVDLVEPGQLEIAGSGAKIVMQKRFEDAVPHMLVTLWRGLSVG